MADNHVDLDRLLLHWRKLAHGDRKAILRRMAPEQRIALEQTLMVRRRPAAAPDQVDDEFSGYSAWLADILRASANRTQDEVFPTLKPAVREALDAAHTNVERPSEDKPRPSLLSLARTALLEGRLWG